jgi:hypothetical protein
MSPTQFVVVEAKIKYLPEAAKIWFSAHPEYLGDPTKILQLQAAHAYIIKTKHHPAFSKEYLDEPDVRLDHLSY